MDIEGAGAPAEDNIQAVFLPLDRHVNNSPRQRRRNAKQLLGNWWRSIKQGCDWCERGLTMTVYYLIRKAKDLGDWYTSSSTAAESGFAGEAANLEPYFSIPVVPPASL